MNAEEKERGKISFHNERDATSPDVSRWVFVLTYGKRFDSNWPPVLNFPLYMLIKCLALKKHIVAICVFVFEIKGSLAWKVWT